MTSLIFLLFIGLALTQALQIRASTSDTTNMTDPSSTEVLSTISIKSEFPTISPDGKILLLYNYATNSIGVYDVSNLQSPTLSSSISLESSSNPSVSAMISPDSKTGYIVHGNQRAGELLVVDLSDPLSPVTLSAFNLPLGTGPAIISPDGQTIFIYSNCPQQGSVNASMMIIDVSNPTLPNQLSLSEQFGGCSPMNPFLRLSGDNLMFNQGCILEVLDISDLTSPKLVLMQNMSYCLESLVLSPDGKTAFAIEQVPINNSASFYSTSLTVLNLTDLTSIQEIATLGLDFAYAFGLGTMAISPNNNYIFVAGSELLLVIDVSDVQNMSYKEVETISEPTFISLSSDGRTLFAASQTQVSIIELYIDRRPSQKFIFPSNAIQELIVLPDWGNLDNIVISSDQNTAFVTYNSLPYSESTFAILDISNKTAPTPLSLFNISPTTSINSITISFDEKTAYLACEGGVLVLNISNMTSPTLINSLSVSVDGESQIIALYSDGQIAFLLSGFGFQILNVTDPANPSNISAYNSSTDNDFENLAIALTLSQDEKYIFLLLWNFPIYVFEIVDISDLSSPKRVSLIEIPDDDDHEQEDDYLSFSVSPDNKAAFVFIDDIYEGKEMNVFDLSNPASPIEIDWSDYNIVSSQQVIISSDSSTAFIATSTELLLMDITRLATPQILRAYPIFMQVVSMFLSDDESTIYLAASNGTLTVINLQPQYALEMWNNEFVLGEVYSNTLDAFQINKNRYLEPMDQNYSFATMSLYNVIYSPGANATETYPMLPNWIEFDQSHGIVTFSPSTQDDIGPYQIYSAMSFMIPDDIFVGVANITDQTGSLDLIVALMSLGYMNTQGFLTSNYDPNTRLYLSSQYLSFESDIRSKLSPYYIEMTTSIIVDSSLSLSASKYISVNTKSGGTVSVTISILKANTTQAQAQAQFVQGNYPIIATYSSDQSSITMEGTLTSINDALGEIIINLNENVTSCNASIIVSDGLNPTLSQNITNISSYFILNEAPTIAYSVQDEVSRTQIYTGEQFIIQINGTFIDPNGQDLDYSISMQDGTQVPDWLTFRDSSLIGTPPEQVTGSDIDIVITAQNQFKSSQQPVTLKIKISMIYALKLVATYGGAFITVVGLWIHMGTIHNIFCRRRYRYPKDFFIKVGDEQSVRNICNIAFIAKEIKASEIVLNEIKKAVGIRCNIENPTNSQLASYFSLDKTLKLNEDKVIQMTRDAMLKLGIVDMDQYDDNSYIKGYLNKEVIQKIIVHKIVSYQLLMNGEGWTEQAFNKVKRFWSVLIETSPNLSQFRLDRTELRKILRLKGQTKSNRPAQTQDNEAVPNEKCSINDEEDIIELNNHHQLNRSDDEPSLTLQHEQQAKSQDQTPLLQNEPSRRERSKINLDLLEGLLIGTAFKYHHLDMNPYDIKVVINQRPSGNRLWMNTKKLFKRDLASIEFAGKGEAAYGIRYEVKKGVLRFYGAAEEELKGETLVVQVTDKKGWILRELWIHCMAGSVKVENKKNL